MDADTSVFVAKYAAELSDDNAAIFVGAGLSKAAGYVDWPGLLAPAARELNLKVAKENDLVALAQYYVNQKGANRHELAKLLIQNFSDLREPTENHKILARLPVRTFWTTNYDALMETALADAGKRIDVKYTTDQLTTTKPQRDVVVYKMHGDIAHPNLAILTKDDYEKYHRTHEPFVTALSGALVSTTFCFLGFSFSDPNLDYILSRIRVAFTTNQRTHYCVTKRRARSEFATKAEFDYATTKQQLVTQDLLRFNIETTFVSDYAEITEILSAIEKRHRVGTVFVSGSATSYGAWGQAKTDRFVSDLAGKLIQKRFKITTGFGLGIGGPLVTGAVQTIYSGKTARVEDQLVMRPFPVGIRKAAERQKTFERYRYDIISQAGIAIFILGNRQDGKKVINAPGMREEFELAKKMGLWLLPIGASGFMAEELWNEIMKAFPKTFGKVPKKIRTLMELLGAPVKYPNDLIDPIIELVELLSKET